MCRACKSPGTLGIVAFGTTVAPTARCATLRSLRSMVTIEEALVVAGATQADLAAILLKLEDPNVGYSRQDEAMRCFKELDAALLSQPPNASNVKRCNIITAAQKLPQGVNTALCGCCSVLSSSLYA